MHRFDIYTGLGINLFIYLMQLGIYWYVARFPAKEIGMYGYRTPRSMKNQANWDYANTLSNRLMFWLAQLFLVLALLLLLFFHGMLTGQSYICISTGIYLVTVAFLFIITEYKTKQFEKSLD